MNFSHFVVKVHFVYTLKNFVSPYTRIEKAIQILYVDTFFDWLNVNINMSQSLLGSVHSIQFSITICGSYVPKIFRQHDYTNQAKTLSFPSLFSGFSCFLVRE